MNNFTATKCDECAFSGICCNGFFQNPDNGHLMYCRNTSEEPFDIQDYVTVTETVSRRPTIQFDPSKINQTAPNTEFVQPPNVVAFSRIANELAELYSRKNHDYGDSFGKSVGRYGLVSALTRISDKFNRLEQLVLNRDDVQVKDERLEDTLKDLASYCIMTLVALEPQEER